MKILVDADACPVKQIIIEVAKKNSINVIFFADTSHILNLEKHSLIETKTVDKHADSVDFVIVNNLNAGDIVVTQDYGLASMVMAKKAIPVHQNGFIYDDQNIDMLLFQRHISKKLRQSGKKSTKFKKRSFENDEAFRNCLEKLVLKCK